MEMLVCMQFPISISAAVRIFSKNRRQQFAGENHQIKNLLYDESSQLLIFVPYTIQIIYLAITRLGNGNSGCSQSSGICKTKNKHIKSIFFMIKQPY